MAVHKAAKTIFFLVFLVIFGVILGSCDALDSLFPSAGNYKMTILVNDLSLEECSFVKSKDMIRPYFEESVSEDPDISSLIIFIRDSLGEIIGEKIVYGLEEEDALEDCYFILVESLDGTLPEFSMPDDLRVARYEIVTQVMGGKNILQRMEKEFFYLGKNHFSYEGINIYLPGISESPHLIPKDALIMLEANIDFDDNLDPYIVWYEGKKKISEGRFSKGAGRQFWKAPEQSGFFSLHAEIFPVEHFDGLIGYQKRVSLLVSSMDIDIHLISHDISQLVHWYTFEGNLNDLKMNTALINAALINPTLNNTPESSIIPNSENAPMWAGADGTYGLATGFNNVMWLPKVMVNNDVAETWQILFRLKPMNDGDIFSIQFNSSDNVIMKLSIHENKLNLTLTSALNNVSQIFNLPQITEDIEASAFFTAGISFTIQPDSLSANINIFGNIIDAEMALRPITLKTVIEDEFHIMLGSFNTVLTNESDEELIEEKPESSFIVIWDEFALYCMPPMDILAADLNPVIIEDEELQNE